MENDSVNNIINEYNDVLEDNVYIDPEDVDQVIELGNIDNNDTGIQDNAVGDSIVDNSQLTFTGHKDAVFAVRISAIDSRICASGGKDDVAYIWNLSTGEILFSCLGHKDSVAALEFSHDGTLLATADLSGLVQVWQVLTGEQIWTFECSDIEWLRWHHSSHVLLAGVVDGGVWMWKVPSGECKTFPGTGSAASCGILMPDGVRCCVGYEDGIIQVWDLKNTTSLHTIHCNESENASIVSLDCHCDNNLVIAASTDGTAKLLNSSTGKICANFNCCTEGSDDSTEIVAFSKAHNYAAAGTLEGRLLLIDVTAQVVRFTCHTPGGVVKLAWHHCDPLLFTASLDGAAHMWDARSGEMVRQWHGHRGEILDFDLSSDSKTLVTSSEDYTVKVFTVG